MLARRIISAVAMLIAGLVTGIQAQESPWPMFRHDSRHTGRTVYTGPATPTVHWVFEANDGIASSPSIGHNGTIYVGAGGYYEGGGDSSLYAVRPDGSLKWQYKTGRNIGPGNPAGIFSSPAIADDGTVYVGSLDGYLYAIADSVTHGELVWRVFLGQWPIYSSPVIGRNGDIYVGSLNFRLHAVYPNSSLAWSYRTGWCVFSSPALGPEGTIYVGSKDHKLYAFDMSGDLIWSHPIGIFYDGHLIDSSPAIGDDGTIYFGADQYGAAGQAPVPIDTAFYAVNPDGTLKWKLAVGDGVESSPAIGHDGTIYVGSYDSCVYAIEDAGTEGVFKWKFTTGGPVDASPTVDGDGTIYIGSNDSLMYALHPDGSVKWSFATGGAIESSVAIDDNGYMYFGSFDGKLYALGSGAPDVGAVAVDIPTLLKTESTLDPTATFRNYRGSTASFEAFCHITDAGGLVYADTVNIVDLPAAGIRTVSFSPWTVGADTGITYTIIAVADLTDDDNTANDTIEAMAKSVAELPYTCGDLDGDEQVDISDVTLLIDYLFITMGDPPDPYGAGDTDCDGIIDISDLTDVLDYLFISYTPLCLDCP